MVAQKTGFDFKAVFAWLFSIISMIIGLFMLIVSPVGGLFIILSGLFILPPIRSLYTQKFPLRLRSAFIISTIAFLIAFFYSIATFPLSFETSVTRKEPQSLQFTSSEPSFLLAYECSGLVEKIDINGETVTDTALNFICSNGLKVNLQDGENIILVKLYGVDQQREEEYTISFDQEEYEARRAKIAEDEAKKQVEMKEKAKQDAEAKAQKAKEQAYQNKLEEWRKSGGTLSGISPQRIKEEYYEQKDLSDAKGKIYLEGLEGRSVEYAGLINNVRTEMFGDGYYISLKIQGASVFISDPAGKYTSLDSGQLIKVRAVIDSVTSFLGINIYLDKATVEVIN